MFSSIFIIAFIYIVIFYALKKKRIFIKTNYKLNNFKIQSIAATILLTLLDF
jgi:hypothetical protein